MWCEDATYQIREPDDTVVATTHPRPKKRYVVIDGVKLPAPLEEAPEKGDLWLVRSTASDGREATFLRANSPWVPGLIAERNAYATKEDAEAWIEFYRTKREVIEE